MVIQETGIGYYYYETRALTDSTTHQFKVTPITAEGYSATPVSLSVLMVCNPVPPDIDISYANGTELFTISAAS